jgi:hypothetical protein
VVPGWKKSGGYSGSTIVGQVSFEISYPGYGVWLPGSKYWYPGFHLRMSGRMELILPDDCRGILTLWELKSAWLISHGTPEVDQVVFCPWHGSKSGSFWSHVWVMW